MELRFNPIARSDGKVEYRNAIYNHIGTVDCEVNHPRFGWIPFHATPEDVEEYGRALYHQIIANGDIAPYVDTPETRPMFKLGEILPSPEEKIAELEARIAALENRK